eukprot:s3714_g5.t1
MLPGPALPCMPSRDEGTSEGSETVTMEAISRTLQMQLRQDREVLTGEINKAMTQVNARVDDIEVALDGWDPDPSGEETLQKAKGVIRSTSIRTTLGPTSSAEGPDLGRRGDGTQSRLWLAISQSPAKRKRAQLAGQDQRWLVMELGTQLEVEYATETAWYAGEDLPSPTTLHRTQDRGGLTSQTSPATSCPGRSGSPPPSEGGLEPDLPTHVRV